MNTFGKIEAILNNRLVIISSSESLAPDEVVSVFSVVDNPKLKEIGYANPILYPQGELKIVCQQAENKYLAEPFRKTQKITKKIVTPSAFARSISGVLATLQPETKEITEEVQGQWSSELNTSQSLNIQIPKVVSVGDLIGRR
ncbi:MAG: hypothetical protein HZA00_05265 [Nitrospinae bacterium]|nr:hypothetical protein [Nitrospinota bacterium]